MKKGFVTVFLFLIATLLLSNYYFFFPSLDSNYSLSGNYDFSEFGASFSLSHSFDAINFNGFFSFPFNFKFEQMNFLTSMGFNLSKSEKSFIAGYLNFGKSRDYSFGIGALFSNPTALVDFYGGVSYSFGDIPHFILDSVLKFKLSFLDINLGTILVSDFQTFLSTVPVVSLESTVGSLLFRLGYSYQPEIKSLDVKEKHNISLGIGISSRNYIRYLIENSKDIYFDDEYININIRRVTPVAVNIAGQLTVAVLDQSGKEVLKKDFSVEQERLSLSGKVKPGMYKVVLNKKGNFEISLDEKAKTSFIVKAIPDARIDLPSVVTRKEKYTVNVFISSSDSYSSDITVKLDGRELSFHKGFIPNRSFKLDLSINELGPHKIEVYADEKLIAQRTFDVRNQINAEWINRPEKILTLQDLTLNPPKFKFSEIIGNRYEPYSNQEVKFIIKKEGKDENIELSTFTDKEGIASIPLTWENGIYLIEVRPAVPNYSKITFSGQEDFLIRIDPTPKEMVLQTDETDGIYIDTLNKKILLSKDKRSFRIDLDIQDEIGDSVEIGFLKVSIFKVQPNGKLKDMSQDFNLTDRINLANRQGDLISIPISVSPRANTGEYYLFFEFYSDLFEQAQSRWVEVYKVILYKDVVVLAENLTIPGIIKRDVAIAGEPNKLKLLFMWKDGEPIRNSKVTLNYDNKAIEGYTNNEGEMVILTPEPVKDIFEFDFSISYNNIELISGNKKLKVEQVEKGINIPSKIILNLQDLKGVGKYQTKANLLMGKIYDFSLTNENGIDILKGRTTGYNIQKILNEINLPIEPTMKSFVINLLDEQKEPVKVSYSVYGIISDQKGKEYFLGTFKDANINLPISTKDENGKERLFDEFIIVPDGEYFVYRFNSVNITTINAELRPSKRLKVKINVEDDEGRNFENPARYSIYYKERGTEYYLGSVMSGLDATINIPSGLEATDIISLLKVYRKGYQLDIDPSDISVDKTKTLVTIPVKIVAQQHLVSDFSLDLMVNKNKIETPYEIVAHSTDTFYGIPLYSKTIYEKGRGKNYYGPSKFNFTIHLPELGLNNYIEGIGIYSNKEKLPVEITEFANITLCSLNFEKIQYAGAKAIIKVDGREVWKNVINKNAFFPVPDGIHTLEIVLDKYTLPIKIVKDFRKNSIEEEFKLTLVKEKPDMPPYMLKDVLYYPKEDSSYKLYKVLDGTYQLPVEIVSKVKYIRVERAGTLFTLDNSYGFEKDITSENRYKLRYGGKEKQIKLQANSSIAIEFYPLDDDRVVLGFKPSFVDIAENVSLIFRSFQDYSSVGNLILPEKLSNSPALRFVIPSTNLAQNVGSSLRVKIHGYDKDRKFILPIDISQLDERQLVKSELVQVDGVTYTISLIADPSLGDRTQKINLKQPGEYYVEYPGSNSEPLYLRLPDDLDNYKKGVDKSYTIGR